MHIFSKGNPKRRIPFLVR